jgi:hypothetical protein
MASRPTAAFGLAAALVACSMSGCGGTASHDGTHTSPAALAAQRRFIAQATTICQGVRAAERPLRAREEGLKGQPLATAEKAFVSLARQAAAIAHAADARLGALPRPSDDAHAIAQLVQAYGEQASDAGEIASAAASKEGSAGEAASVALSRSIAAHLTSAKSLGMGECLNAE